MNLHFDLLTVLSMIVLVISLVCLPIVLRNLLKNSKQENLKTPQSDKFTNKLSH